MCSRWDSVDWGKHSEFLSIVELKKDEDREVSVAGRYYADCKSSLNFIAANKFKGSKPGFIFKRDTEGLGYYRDIWQ